MSKSERLIQALNDEFYKSHNIGDTYKMDGKGKWKIAYYPIFECGKTGEIYAEPRALVEQPIVKKDKKGIDFREVPLRYLERNKV